MRGIEIYEPEFELLASGKSATIVRKEFSQYRGFVVIYRSRKINRELCDKNGVNPDEMNKEVFVGVGRLIKVVAKNGGYVYFFSEVERIKEVRYPVKMNGVLFNLPEGLEIKVGVAGWDEKEYYKVPLKMMKKGQIALCHAIFVGNPYKRCAHGCLYCYAQRHLSRYSGKYPGWKPVPLDITLLEKAFERAKNGAKDLTSICIRNKYILRFGNMTDPLQPVERQYKVTQKYLEILKRENYPYFLCTKSDMVAEEPYIGYLKEKNAGFVQMSLPSLNKKLLKIMEPNVPSPKARIDAMKKLTDEGIKVQVRVAPFFPVIMDDWQELFDELHEAGVYHIITQFLVPDKMFLREIKELLDIDYMKVVQDAGFNYRFDETKSARMYFVMPELAVWRDWCKKWKEYLDSLGMSYGDCMIAPDCMTTSSCCGLDDWYHHRGTLKEMIPYLRENGEMSWEQARGNFKTPSWKAVKEAWNGGLYGLLNPEVVYDGVKNVYKHDGKWFKFMYPEGVRISKGLDKY